MVDAETGGPLEGAAILLKGHKVSAISNPQGEFVVAPIRDDGPHEIVVRRNGYKEATAASIPVDTGYYTKVEVRLERGDPAVDRWPAITSPRLVYAPPIQYLVTPQLVGTLVVIKCTVTVEGRVVDCVSETEIPDLGSMIRQIEARRFKPATQDGKPIEIDYTFKVRPMPQ